MVSRGLLRVLGMVAVWLCSCTAVPTTMWRPPPSFSTSIREGAITIHYDDTENSTITVGSVFSRAGPAFSAFNSSGNGGATGWTAAPVVTADSDGHGW